MPRYRARTWVRQLGHRIRARRLRAGMTRVRFAEMIGVSLQQVHSYETGAANPPASTLYRIATSLRISADALMGTKEKGDREEEIAMMTKAFADRWIGGVIKHMLEMPDEERRLIHAAVTGIAAKIPEQIQRVEVMQ